MSFKTDIKDFIKEAHGNLKGAIYPVFFVFSGVLIFFGFVMVATFPWGFVAIGSFCSALYGIYRVIQWAERG